MSKSPTQCTLDECRKRGWIAQVVEHWLIVPARRIGSDVIPERKVRKDLFGFVDVVAVEPSGIIHCVQATTWGNVSHRYAKIIGDQQMASTARRLIEHNLVAIVGWKQEGGKGSRYVGKWRYLVPEDFAEPVLIEFDECDLERIE